MSAIVPGLKTLVFEEREPRIGVVTMNRAEQLNAINMEMLGEFEALFEALSRDDTIRVLVITGAGRGFSSGADLNDAVVFRDSQAFADPENFLKIVQERYASLILRMRRIPQPVIAAVNGPAAGGGFSMALASDVRFASPEAYFVASFINIGLSGGELGCSYLLPRLVGLGKAMELMLGGEIIDAREAERIGLVNRVVPHEQLHETVMALARALAARPAGSLGLMKSMLYRALSMDLPAVLEMEALALSAAVKTEEHQAIVRGFLAERAART